MADKMYAWCDITHDAEVDESGAGRKNKYVRRGEEVSKSKLGVSDEDWNALIEAGSIRPKKFPDVPASYQGSVIEWYREELTKAEEAAGADIAMSMGGSYFGPDPEDIMDDLEASGVQTDNSPKEAPSEKEK